MDKRSSLVGVAAMALTVALLPTSGAEATGTTSLSIAVKEVESRKIAVSLRCAPPEGTHPAAQDACAQIESAGGDFEKLPGRQTFAACAKIFLPVVATATGVAQGKTVKYRRTFPNRCEMGVATGSVFEVFPPQ